MSFRGVFLFVMSALAVWGAPAVVIYRNGTSAAVEAQMGAELLVSRRFVEIGVPVEWRFGEPHTPPPPGQRFIVVKLQLQTNPSQAPKALAQSWPYEGVHITVFYDRIAARAHPGDRPLLLGYVLIHEITHILEGMARHSPEGVMKAVWRPADYYEMFCHGLELSSIDVDMIRDGLEDWSSRHTSSVTAPM